MKHLFKATKMGWAKEKEVSISIQAISPPKKPNKSSKNITEQQIEGILTLVTNMMVKNIMM